MFVQVIRGRVADPQPVHAALDSWSRQLAPGAPGWLGSTAGVTEDGRFIALARFESEEAARRNEHRQEQSQWWQETSKLLRDVTFRDSDDVIADVHGDPDSAGFLQVMQGRSTDPERAKELMTQNPGEWADFRPDVIGSLSVGQEGGSYTMATYFSSEQAAREGERKEPPPELQAQMAEMNKLSVGETEFLDLKEPWLYSP